MLDSPDEEPFPIEQLIAQMGLDSEDLTRNLERFCEEREAVVEAQKKAIVAYEAEIARIEEEYSHLDRGADHGLKKGVDHNIMKHLKLDLSTGVAGSDSLDPNNNDDNAPPLRFPDKKRLGETDHFHDSAAPPPSFDDKRQARERMFDFFEQSAVDETRLEIQLEKAREEKNWALVEEVSEALLLLQRQNNETLNSLVSSYRPAMFGKNWGNDPDYLQLSKQLKSVTDSFNLDAEQLPDVVTAGTKRRV